MTEAEQDYRQAVDIAEKIDALLEGFPPAACTMALIMVMAEREASAPRPDIDDLVRMTSHWLRETFEHLLEEKAKLEKTP